MVSNDLHVMSYLFFLWPPSYINRCVNTLSTLHSSFIFTDGVGTIGGNSGGEVCIFPFVYNGVQYDTCTDTDNNGILWCATADLDGINYNSQTSKWGNCIGMLNIFM